MKKLALVFASLALAATPVLAGPRRGGEASDNAPRTAEKAKEQPKAKEADKAKARDTIDQPAEDRQAGREEGATRSRAASARAWPRVAGHQRAPSSPRGAAFAAPFAFSARPALPATRMRDRADPARCSGFGACGATPRRVCETEPAPAPFAFSVRAALPRDACAIPSQPRPRSRFRCVLPLVQPRRSWVVVISLVAAACGKAGAPASAPLGSAAVGAAPAGSAATGDASGTR